MSGGNRISAAGKSNAADNEAKVNEALNLMHKALKLLDANHGPHDVCAHLDLAINRLRESIDKGEDAAG